MSFVSTQVTLATGETVTVYYLSEAGKKFFEGLLAADKYTDGRFDVVFKRFAQMEDELVRTFFLPKIQAHIVESLRLKDKTQQEVAKTLPDFTGNPMTYHAFHMAWTQFEKAGVILPISHGKGHPRTWELSILKKE
jgi:hypothetical protein